MTKSEIIEHLSTEAGISKSEAVMALNALVDLMTQTVARGDKFVLPGVGIFERAHRPARLGRNLQTGDPIQVPARFAPKFKAAKQFKDLMPAMAKSAGKAKAVKRA